jgi:hypothetical protein
MTLLYFFIPELSILWGVFFTAGVIIILQRLLQKKVLLMLGYDTKDSHDYDSCINYSDGKF